MEGIAAFSNDRLNTLLYFHPHPINLVVHKERNFYKPYLQLTFPLDMLSGVMFFSCNYPALL